MDSEVQEREDPTKGTVSWVNELAVKEGALERFRELMEEMVSGTSSISNGLRRSHTSASIMYIDTPGNCGPDLRDLRLAQRSAAYGPRLPGVAAGTNPTGAAVRICSEATAEARRQPRRRWPVSWLAAEGDAVLGGELRKGPGLASDQPGHLISDPGGVAVRHHDVELDQALDQPAGQASAG